MDWSDAIQFGALGILGMVVWLVFAKLAPDAIKRFEAITVRFTEALHQQRTEFRDEMRDERMCRQQEMAEVREGMQGIANEVRDLRERMAD